MLSWKSHRTEPWVIKCLYCTQAEACNPQQCVYWCCLQHLVSGIFVISWSITYDMQEVHAIYRRYTVYLHHLQWAGYWSDWYTLGRKWLSVVFFLGLMGQKELEEVQSYHMLEKKGAHTCVAQVPTQHLWHLLHLKRWVFLSFAEDVLTAVFSPVPLPGDSLPSDSWSHW